MSDLFSSAPAAPLAELMRPQHLRDVVGQSHLLGPGAPLRLSFDSGKLHSSILWGPPGVGKTTLARLAAQQSGYEFMALSAVEAGVKDIRLMAERAQTFLDMRSRKTLLFIDEIHRLNKAQQDALLPYVESGLFTFFCATTENVSFELNAALLSRAQVYRLTPLTDAELRELFARAKPHLQGLQFEDAALEFLVGLADGDGRRLLNLLEATRNAAHAAGRTHIDETFAMATAGTRVRRFDKSGDAFYDQISALHKSIRGSSPDAALYWLARMLDAGADARYIARRLVVIASEDVGNADPRALEVATNAALAYERVGAPEGELALAHAVVYLAVAPKSNAVYQAWKAAKAFVAADSSRAVPLHLRNAPTALLKDLGHGASYRYAHNEPGAYAAGENYWPSDMEPPTWYEPTERGLEARIAERLAQLRELDAQARKNG